MNQSCNENILVADDSKHTPDWQAMAKNAKAMPRENCSMIAIASSKGGVGKTLIAANIAYYLTRQNRSATIIDLNLASPSLHTLFKIGAPAKTIKNLITVPGTQLSDLAVETEVKNLKLVCGSRDSLNIQENADSFANKLIDSVKRLSADYVIIDLGTGVSQFDAKLFLSAQTALLVGTPEPTAISNNLKFLKLCILQRLEEIFKDDAVSMETIRQAYLSLDTAVKEKIKKLIKNIKDASKARHNNRRINFFPEFILNMVRDDIDVTYAKAIDAHLNDSFGLNVKQAGTIPFSNQLRSQLKTDTINNLLKNANGSSTFYDKLIRKIITNSNGENKRHEPIRIEKLTNAKRNLGHYQKHLICSSYCGLWGDCAYQHGGYPCKIKYIGFINTN
jgi:MinD-like ATPase involved in chromosome partitioning or flagellar assembly